MFFNQICRLDLTVLLDHYDNQYVFFLSHIMFQEYLQHKILIL
jgi:hypothetical protein